MTNATLSRAVLSALTVLVALSASTAGAEPPRTQVSTCGGLDQACCAPRDACSAGLDCRGTCKPVHHGDLTRSQGARSTRVVLVNQTSRGLTAMSHKDFHGGFSTLPAARIPSHDYAQWQMDSGGIATGNEGEAYFRIDGVSAPVMLHWDNPFIGDNSYRSITPPGYLLSRSGGEGMDTTVFYFLREASRPAHDCAALWVANNLWNHPNDGEVEASLAIGFLTTALKRAGIKGWFHTGCGARASGTLVRDAQYGTDGFWTLDLALDGMQIDDVSALAGLAPNDRRALRLEVRPDMPAHAAFPTRCLRVPIVAAASRLPGCDRYWPKAGDHIIAAGEVMGDHGGPPHGFLEIHPSGPLVVTAR